MLLYISTNARHTILSEQQVHFTCMFESNTYRFCWLVELCGVERVRFLDGNGVVVFYGQRVANMTNCLRVTSSGVSM